MILLFHEALTKLSPEEVRKVGAPDEPAIIKGCAKQLGRPNTRSCERR